MNTSCSSGICSYWAVKMVILVAWAEKVKVNKFPSIERILRNTGFYKLFGLSQRSQPYTLEVDLQNK
jgi:hypothetical protein